MRSAHFLNIGKASLFNTFHTQRQLKVLYTIIKIKVKRKKQQHNIKWRSRCQKKINTINKSFLFFPYGTNTFQISNVRSYQTVDASSSHLSKVQTLTPVTICGAYWRRFSSQQLKKHCCDTEKAVGNNAIVNVMKAKGGETVRLFALARWCMSDPISELDQQQMLIFHTKLEQRHLYLNIYLWILYSFGLHSQSKQPCKIELCKTCIFLFQVAVNQTVYDMYTPFPLENVLVSIPLTCDSLISPLLSFKSSYFISCLSTFNWPCFESTPTEPSLML